MNPEKLTIIERALLANQNRILALLNVDNSDYYEKLAEIAENGYEGLYYELFDHIHEGISMEICEETFDILTMYRVINNAIATLSEEQKESIDLNKIKFEGFDANNDSHYFFMEFLIEKENKYEEYKKMYRNSHSISTIRKYRQLLEVYQLRKANGQNELKYEDLKEMVSKI